MPEVTQRVSGRDRNRNQAHWTVPPLLSALPDLHLISVAAGKRLLCHPHLWGLIPDEPSEIGPSPASRCLCAGPVLPPPSLLLGPGGVSRPIWLPCVVLSIPGGSSDSCEVGVLQEAAPHCLWGRTRCSVAAFPSILSRLVLWVAGAGCTYWFSLSEAIIQSSSCGRCGSYHPAVCVRAGAEFVQAKNIRKQ